MQQRIIIFAGGNLGPWALQPITPSDTLIGADSGAIYLIKNGFAPHIAIGDFDSVTAGEMELIRERSGNTISCDPIDKNYTDTEMAFRLALDMKPEQVLLLGALGTRFDHSLANVHLLALANEQGVEAAIADEHNEIHLITKTTLFHRDHHPQVSLLPLSEQVTGITLTGFQYPLHEATLSIGQSLGISNVMTAGQGTIELREGMLLVIRSRD
ncbi:thiamine diphosphokinase [Paenibacillus sp. 1011MAR3C5]|uniref:thiamine diphosphokinase n=1 Tax=Paenibacillus sp. 1011MAR3C5 TaxID=1675787 RepID=UPI000E6BA740|nr:thiamine diphosphokinase [Paenibacillus sp. 1011MAR3C5]RJE90189.1 thiamine diphosphokinase [Paenibacillus sp. 1011MAR3C5]